VRFKGLDKLRATVAFLDKMAAAEFGRETPRLSCNSKVSLLRSQDPYTGPCREPAETLFSLDPF
jgi:hypothetical protein